MTSAAMAVFAPAAAAPAPAPAPATEGSPKPATEASNAIANPPPAPATWFDGFQNPEVKTWTQAKGWKDAGAMAESAFNLEKLIGHEKAGRTLVVPGADATPEERAAFNTKLGVPAKAEDYSLPALEGTPTDFQTTAKGWMHKAGVPPGAAQTLAEEWVNFSKAQQETHKQALITQGDQAFAKVTESWGKEAEANLELGKRAAATVLPAEVEMDDGTKLPRGEFMERLFNGTGATAAMTRLFADIGKGMGEHKVHQPGSTQTLGNLTPAQAQQKIQQLRADPVWSKGYIEGDKAKLAEMTNLVKQANPV